MAYTIELTDAAARALSALPKNMLRRVDAKILALANDPRPHGVKLLSGTDLIASIESVSATTASFTRSKTIGWW